MTQLILGTCANYSTEQLRPFVDSLRSTDYAGDVTFLVHGISPATVRFLHERDCRTLPFRQMPYFKGAHRVRQSMARLVRLCWSRSRPPAAIRSLLAQCWQCAASRYFRYESYLRSLDGQFDLVMLTDVRDVVFQSNPFAFPMTGQLCAFRESLARIGDDYYNSQWLKDAYGQAVYEQLQDLPVYCSGVTIGTISGVQDYLRAMTKHLASRVGFTGYDQGVHNYLVHTGALRDVVHYENWQGPVLTLGAVASQDICVAGDGLLRTRAGEVINVLHQYDRQAALARSVVERISCRTEPASEVH
jgi:hypothetical protein